MEDVGQVWLWTSYFINSSWPSEAIWRNRSGSTLVQVMAWCHQAPSHYMNHCWTLINEFWQQCHSDCPSYYSIWRVCIIKLLKLQPHLPGANELNIFPLFSHSHKMPQGCHPCYPHSDWWWVLEIHASHLQLWVLSQSLSNLVGVWCSCYGWFTQCTKRHAFQFSSWFSFTISVWFTDSLRLGQNIYVCTYICYDIDCLIVN